MRSGSRQPPHDHDRPLRACETTPGRKPRPQASMRAGERASVGQIELTRRSRPTPTRFRICSRRIPRRSRTSSRLPIAISRHDGEAGKVNRMFYRPTWTQGVLTGVDGPESLLHVSTEPQRVDLQNPCGRVAHGSVGSTPAPLRDALTSGSACCPRPRQTCRPASRLVPATGGIRRSARRSAAAS